MRLLDLFCGAGGAAMGYHRAGFDEIVGVDNRPMPRYPFTFVLGDALDYCREHGHEFDAIHASPPCPRFSELTRLRGKPKDHPDLIDPVRQILKHSGRPHVIENVPGAPLRIDVMLCGTMFGLGMARHRIFESSVPMPVLTMACRHVNLYDPYHGGEQAQNERAKTAAALGIDWFMTRPEVRNVIPPAYTEWLGRRLLEALR